MIHFLRLAAFVLSLTFAAAAPAQSVWSRPQLDAVRDNVASPLYARAYEKLLSQADGLLDVAPLSVMMKQKASPSGDNHDYTSLARYFHPNPDTPDGLPYVNRDGVTNPEIALYDRENLGATASRVATLALAAYLSGDERYARKAAELVRVWFLDPATKMNPQLEYAQMVPGVNGNKGRCYGVLDGYSLVEVLDGVALLKETGAWTAADDRGLRQWMGEFLDWMLTSPQGVEEASQANNHSTAYDALAIAVAIYAGRHDVTRRIIGEVPGRRIFTQIEPDGMQPHEMWRTLSFGYSQYNLTHFIDIFLMAQKLGMKIDKSADSQGRSFYRAMDLLASYLGKCPESWPGQQISDWDGKQQALARDLWRVGTLVDKSRSDYRQAYGPYAAADAADRFVLLYGRPESPAAVHSINDGWRVSIGGVESSVHLPHCWNSDAYGTRNYYRGKGTYSRSLEIPATMAGRRIYLKFDGAAAKSAVYVDGRKAGEHVGAYSPHIVDVTDFVKPGGVHNLTVEVDNSDPSVPPYSADFTFMGGLYRDAWLIDKPAVHSDFSVGPASGFRLRAEPDGGKGWKLLFSSRLLNRGTKPAVAELEAVLSDASGNTVATRSARVRLGAMSDKDVSLTFNDIHPELWSPEHPTLYRVEMTLSVGGDVLERESDYTAFRTFAFDAEGRFLLNGKPYKLRGMCRHQDQAPMGYALTDEQHRRDMRLIKDMGANFIRISHYPQDEAVLEMCDRLGLIAWEEVPVIDYVPADSAFADNAETMLRQMIRRDYNHPSVAMWGYMNEILLRTPGHEREATQQRTRRLADRLEGVLRSEDPHRLSAMAFHGSDVYHQAGLGEITDVKGWNLYQGWYGGRTDEFEQFLSRQHREHPGHRLIVSEYGAGSDLRLHSLRPEPFDFSMEYQQQYLEHYLPVIEDSAFVAGASHWNFIDFSSANRAESMPHINNKGLVTNDRRPKDVYHYYRAMWTTDTVAHIAVRDWPRRTELVGPEGYVVRPVKVYTNLPEVSLQGQTKAVNNCSAVFEVRLYPGTNLLRLTDAAGRLLDAAAVDLQAIRHDGRRLQPGTSEVAVNVGSNCYFRSDDSGLEWLPDREYTPGGLYGCIGGKTAVSQDEMALTADQPLLQRCRSGIEEYRFDVEPGRYEIEMSFADLASPSAQSAYMLGHNAGDSDGGVTRMDVYINGKMVEKDFAPSELSGVKSMVRRRYHAEAADGIRIVFKAARGAVTSLAAIKIRKI